MGILVVPASYLCAAYFITPNHLLATTVGGPTGAFVSIATANVFKSIAYNTLLGKNSTTLRSGATPSFLQKIIDIASTALQYTSLYFSQKYLIGLMGGQLTGVVPWAHLLGISAVSTLVITTVLAPLVLGGVSLFFYIKNKI